MALLKAGRRGSGAAKRCDRAQRKGRFDQQDLIGDCTFAFFEAPTPAAASRYLSTRSVAWLIARQDQHLATADNQIAVALDPGNPEWRSNLGYSYLQVRHSWAALREFERSLAIRKSWVALAGRASAKYNLGDKDGAFDDAKASFELESNELALIVLGDLFKDRGDEASAKKMWMAAWRMGSRDDGTIQRLRSVGVEHPERESR
jgi:tetratricopeptide (TPR) repeat protein